VDDQEEKEKAERALRRVKGVEAVDNRIQIGQVRTKYPRGV
jgi:osmotically-inducible protein OsmY